ncbi:DsrE family protein [Thalassoglobus sp. JC818]|uniref:DsrE family protein n=1 Tax=Thalassoglobus sp. JC818 TaxID=3232136 RepID=UPI003459D7D5
MYRTTVTSLMILALASAIHSQANAQSSATASPTAGEESFQYSNPRIADFGKVVNLPEAAHQPREGSKIVVDITKGSDPDKLNSAIEKVCRFVNIYAGAGKNSADVRIAVVLHGDATLAVLNDAAYATRFKTNGNPSLACLRQLKDAGVDVFVCGQSLIGTGAKPSEVSDQAKVAVSALTALVNLQKDGYAYLPMLK